MRVGRLARFLLASALAGAWAPALRAADESLLAPDDLVVFVRNNDLFVVGGSGKGVRQLTSTSDREIGASGCPDGASVVYEAFDSQRNEFAIFVLPIEGGIARKVVPVGHAPAWSPDGGRLLYTANVRGGYDVFMCNRNGGGVQRLTDTPGSEMYPVWSPDGTHVAYVRDRQDGQQRSQLVVLRDAMGKETELATLVAMQVTKMNWSPGPNLIVSGRTTDTPARDALYEIKPEPGKPRQLTQGLDNELWGSWLPRGNGLLATQVSRSTARPILRTTEASGKPLPGTEAGDADPCVVPGPSSRAPQIYVNTRRSFYLPTARLAGDDVLLPLGELAKQLGWQVVPDGANLKLTQGDTSLALNPADGTLTAGETKTTLTPTPTMVAGALMVPARTMATALAARCEWDGQARVLRLSSRKEEPHAPTGRPQG